MAEIASKIQGARSAFSTAKGLLSRDPRAYLKLAKDLWNTPHKWLLLCAAIVDAIGIIPIVGDAINWIGFICIWIYLAIRGFEPWTASVKKPGRSTLNFLGESLVEAFLLLWPGTLIMTYTAVQHKMEKEAKAKAEEEQKQLLAAKLRNDYIHRYRAALEEEWETTMTENQDFSEPASSAAPRFTSPSSSTPKNNQGSPKNPNRPKWTDRYRLYGRA